MNWYRAWIIVTAMCSSGAYAQNYIDYCECITGKASCLRSKAECTRYCGGDDWVKNYRSRTGECPDLPEIPPRPPAAQPVPSHIVEKLKNGTPVLAVLVYPERPDTNQCIGSADGRLYAAQNEWTDWVRIDTDGRPGGCRQAFAVYDPKGLFQTDALQVLFRSTRVDAPDAQCGNQGVHRIPIYSEMQGEAQFSSELRIDTDNRAGGCLEWFQAFSLTENPKTALVLWVEFASDGGDAGQCGNPGTHTTADGVGTTQMLLDTDSRDGGCRQRFMLEVHPKP